MKGAGAIPKSDQIYLKVSQESYKPIGKREGLLNNEYMLDPDLSNERTVTYVSPKNIIIGNRGTIPTDSQDLKEDALIIAGHFDKSPRVKSTLDLIHKTMMKYPGLPIINTGHSLGGRVSQSLGLLLPLMDSKVVVFNPGASPLDISTNIKDLALCKLTNSEHCKKLKNQTIYSTGFDPISISSLLHSGRTKIIGSEKFNIHALSNFL
jgi:hypothetical protein